MTDDDRARRGGTLRMVGAGDVDHLDPALAHHTATRGLQRACTRQLVGYVASRDRATAGRIVADMATEVPTTANGRISADGRCYTFTLRDDVRWGPGAGNRRVTAQDVVRGLKRLADPRAPSPGLAYYLGSLAGMTGFRDALARDPAEPGRRLEDTPLPGACACGDADVRLTAIHPAGDFLNLLALPFATPAPAEYLPFAPGSPELEEILCWNGPYAVTRYTPGTLIVLERNPGWEPSSDPLRPAHLDRVEVHEGVGEAEAHRMVAAGEADMLWDVQPLTAELPELMRTGDERLEVYPAGLFSPYLVVNFAERTGRAAVRARAVREAVAYAVDKAAVSDVWGGPRLNDVADQILPPLCSAHRPARFHATPDGRGDPRRARALLAAAGHPDGLDLTLVFRDRDIHPDTAEAVRAAVARAGIRLDLRPVSLGVLFDDYLGGTTGSWDLALTGWEPDWYGNNARTYLQPLLDSRDVTDGADGDWGSNFGHYRNERINALLTAASRCADEDRAGELFRRIEAEAMTDCAIVPILFAHQYWFRAARVRNWLPYPVLNGDLTNLWVDGR